MKPVRLLILFALLLLVVAPVPVLAQTPTPSTGMTIEGDQVVIGNTFQLQSGDTLDGNLLIIGGTASTQTGTQVNGDIVLVGGTISLEGELDGDIVAIGGAVLVKETAVVDGSLTMIGANLQRMPGAVINGGVTQQNPDLFRFSVPEGDQWGLPFASWKNPLARMLNASLQALGMGILAVIIGLLLPKQLKRVSNELTREPLVAGGVGLLTIILAPIILVLLVITILLIPVAVITIIVLSLAILFGLIAVGYEIGERLSGMFKATWHPSIAAGIGTLLLTLVIGFANMIPCVGWLLGLVAGFLGLGAVVISRFGSEKYAAKVVHAVIPDSIPTPSVGVAPEPPVENNQNITSAGGNDENN
jgi:hypothetical protein